MTLALHLAVNHLVEVLSGLIVRRDDEGRVRVFDVLVCDGGQSLLALTNLVHAALLVELFDGTLHLTAGQLFNHLLQRGILLPQDLVETSGVETSLLELLIRPAGIDRFMLAHVADEQQAVLRSEAAEKRMHLCGAGQTRFIQQIQPPLVGPRVFLVVCQVPLQRAIPDASLSEVGGRTGSRSKALDLVARTLGSIADRRERRRLASAGGAVEGHNLIATRQNLPDGCALALIQVVILARDCLAGAVAHHLRKLALADTHQIDRLAFKFDHRRSRERSARRAWRLLHGDELASLGATLDLALDVLDARLSERSLQRVLQDRPFIHDRFALQIAVACERDGGPHDARWLTLVLNMMGTAPLGGVHDLRRLATEPVGEILMAPLHLLMRHVELGFSGLVGRDLRGGGALPILAGQVCLNLLTPRAGGVEVLARVAADLGLPAATALDLVTERAQSRRQLGPIYGGRILLCAIQLTRLQRTDRPAGGLRPIEDHCVRVKLRCRVAIHRARTVVFEQRRNEIPGRFGPAIPTKPRLHVRLQLIEGDVDALTVRFTDTLVAANQRRE